MGYRFSFKRDLGALEQEVFFSYRDYELGGRSNPEHPNKLLHLSLGSSISDWHIPTLQKTLDIFEVLIGDAVELVSSQGLPATNKREIEILFGNLCFHLAQRVARAEAQIRLIEESQTTRVNRLTLPQSLDFALPRETADSMSLLMSPKFGELIEFFATSRFFNVPGSLEVNVRDEGHLLPREPEESRNDVTVGQSVYLKLQNFLRRFSRNNRYFVISPYLGSWGAIGLNLLLRQVPTFLEFRKKPQKSNSDLSRRVAFDLDAPIGNHVKGFFHLLAPSSLLEEFHSTRHHALRLGFPIKPEVVFTSNAFFYDDVFKAHLVGVISNAKYMVGQHGNYGVSMIHEPGPELQASDLFLGWGWKSENEKIIPFGQIKPKVKSGYPTTIRGVTLLLRDSDETLLNVDMAKPNENYYARVLVLCKDLNNHQIKTQLRLHSSTTNETKNVLAEVIKNLEFVEIAVDRPSLADLVRSGWFVAFTYDSTGMLELGTAKIPFFSFLPDGLDLIKPQFQRNYLQLKEVGLLSEDADEAALLIARWVKWPRTQREKSSEAISRFTEGLAFYPRHKLRKLAAEIRQMAPLAHSKSSNSHLDAHE